MNFSKTSSIVSEVGCILSSRKNDQSLSSSVTNSKEGKYPIDSTVEFSAKHSCNAEISVDFEAKFWASPSRKCFTGLMVKVN